MSTLQPIQFSQFSDSSHSGGRRKHVKFGHSPKQVANLWAGVCVEFSCQQCK